MIGARVKPAIGASIGPAIGLGADPFGGGSSPMSGVTKDATSGIYCPASAAEWAIALSVAGIASGGPSLLWLMQQASGNLTDSIGSFTGTASGTLAYHQAVTGWSRLALGTTDGVAGKVLNTAVPDVGTTSVLLINYMGCSFAGAERTLAQFNNVFASRVSNEATSSGKHRVFSASVSATGTLNPFNGPIRPMTLRVNHTLLTETGFSDIEKLIPTHQTIGGTPALILGGDNTVTNFPGTAQYLYTVLFTGAAAELTDAQVKTLLQTLGWTISWS